MKPEERIHCTELLPVEMWDVVLGNLESLEDLLNCYRTCSTWRSMLLLVPKVKAILALHKVIPILWKTLGWTQLDDYREIVKCRLVCRSWKRAVDATFLQEDWDWEQSMSKKTFELGDLNHCIDPSVQGSKVWSTKGYNYFADMDHQQQQQSGPFLGGTLQYEFRWESRQDSAFTAMSLLNGVHVRNLVLRIEKNSLFQAEPLLSLFHNFPNLRRLKLLFVLDKDHCYKRNTILVPWNLVSSNPARDALLQVEKEVLQSLKESSRRPVSLKNLAELTIFNIEQVMPLPKLVAALLAHSPALRKVTLVWGRDQRETLLIDREMYDEEHRRNLSTVLTSISSSSSLSQLVLIGWGEQLSLPELLPNLPWLLRHLTQLTVQQHLSTAAAAGAGATGEEMIGQSDMRTFRQLLKRFSGSSSSLEQLWVRSPPNAPCQRFGVAGHAAGSKQLVCYRTCSCNDFYNQRETSEEILKFHRACEKNRLKRLKVLGLPHSLLHPFSFPQVMKACPSIEQLWIYNIPIPVRMNRRDGGRRAGVDIMAELVSELWPESPPSLRLIVVQNMGGGEYKFWRTSPSSFQSRRRSTGESKRRGSGLATPRGSVAALMEKDAKKCLLQ